ncbi:MAG: metallophosphoesterase, partial [Victivallales bacterium]|nr:metallophosphoesterase [Victivallales bacterium]
RTEPLQKNTYTFRPLEKTEGIKIFMLPDTHNRVKAATEAAQYFGKELDLLILNGDISEGLSNYNSIANIYKIAGVITNGEIPVVYARGNHELRGAMAEQLHMYAPNRDGYIYYTFRVGPIWGIVLDCGEDKDDGHAEYGYTVACHPFRVKETEYLKSIIANATNEYNAADVKYRLIVSHTPFMHINGKPFDIELDLYREWCNLLRENVKPHLMLCGHFHTIRIVRPGHAWDNLGEPCPVVIGSRPGKTMDDYTGTAIELTEKNATIRFVHNTQKIEGEDVIEFK